MNQKVSLLLFFVFLFGSVGGAVPAYSQQNDDGQRSSPSVDASKTDTDRVDSLRASLRVPRPELQGGLRLPPALAILPGSTINTPTGFGARWGQLYAGASIQERIRYSSFTDGVMTMGAGVGDPERYVGLEVTLHVLDTYTDFADDRAVSLKLHRHLPWGSSVAIGWENLWHTDATDGGSSPYAVVSKATRLHEAGPWTPFGVVVTSLGIGGDRFQSEDRFRRRQTGAGVFGSIAVRLVRPVHAIANWTGQDLSLGLSITPIPKLPIVITPALMDVTGRAGDGMRFSASAAIVYDFRGPQGEQ